ncbi:hypothetical protein ACE1SV_65420 [Streptomyces sp. E-15]
MKAHKRVTTTFLSVVLCSGTVLLAPVAQAHEQSPTAATSCYGSAHSYFKPDGDETYPADSGLLTTTSNCSDINLKPNTDRYVAVCWDTGGPVAPCQDHYTLAYAGQWNVIATDVYDGTRFFFTFRSTAQSSGSWAG